MQAILDGIKWLGLDYDEGPIFQTHRFDRYAEVVQQLLEKDKAYHCYCSRERLDALREQQMKDGIKPRYDGRCRNLDDVPAGIKPLYASETRKVVMSAGTTWCAARLLFQMKNSMT